MRKKIAVHVKSKFDLKSKCPLKNFNFKNENTSIEHVQKKAESSQLRDFMRIAYSTLDNLKNTFAYHELAKEFELAEEVESLRWFIWPSEAVTWINTNRENKITSRKFIRSSDKYTSFNESSTLKLPAVKFGSPKHISSSISPKNKLNPDKSSSKFTLTKPPNSKSKINNPLN